MEKTTGVGLRFAESKRNIKSRERHSLVKSNLYCSLLWMTGHTVVRVFLLHV